MMSAAPRACAARLRAGMSCISKVCEPGASVNTTLVFGFISCGDAGPDERIVIGGLDAEARQHRVAEIARRAIDANR